MFNKRFVFMSVIDINCAVCDSVFSFTEEEQEFYQSKGFQPPRKCKPCRDAAKASRGGGYGGGGYGGGYDRPPRQMYDTVCSACGINTQVPFMPNGSKPVYCRDCFRNASAY